MTPLLTLVIEMTLLTFAAIMLAPFLRHREWTLEGLQSGLSNRQALPEETPLGGRAERTAKNTIEALLLFTPLALVAHLAGRDADVLLGANIFFWARVAYIPIYLFGIIYVRSIVWGIGLFGLGSMTLVLLS